MSVVVPMQDIINAFEVLPEPHHRPASSQWHKLQVIIFFITWQYSLISHSTFDVLSSQNAAHVAHRFKAAAAEGGEGIGTLLKLREHGAGYQWLSNLLAIRGRPFPATPVLAYFLYVAAVTILYMLLGGSKLETPSNLVNVGSIPAASLLVNGTTSVLSAPAKIVNNGYHFSFLDFINSVSSLSYASFALFLYVP
jgi:hypothetical protein